MNKSWCSFKCLQLEFCKRHFKSLDLCLVLHAERQDQHHQQPVDVTALVILWSSPRHFMITLTFSMSPKCLNLLVKRPTLSCVFPTSCRFSNCIFLLRQTQQISTRQQPLLLPPRSKVETPSSLLSGLRHYLLKLPPHVVTVYYFYLPASFFGQMVYGVCWHLNRRLTHSFFQHEHQGGAIRASIIHAAARLRGPRLCFHTWKKPQGTWKCPFHP